MPHCGSSAVLPRAFPQRQLGGQLLHGQRGTQSRMRNGARQIATEKKVLRRTISMPLGRIHGAIARPRQLKTGTSKYYRAYRRRAHAAELLGSFWKEAVGQPLAVTFAVGPFTERRSRSSLDYPRAREIAQQVSR